MRKATKADIEFIVHNQYTNLIACYGLTAAKKIISGISRKLRDETRRRRKAENVQ